MKIETAHFRYEWRQSVWYCRSFSAFIYDSLSSRVPICLSASSPCPLHHLFSLLHPPAPLFSSACVPVVTRATALTCWPMFPWARGPLGASQQASLPATSGAGGMERALVSALKVNKAAARHSTSDSWAPRPEWQNTASEQIQPHAYTNLGLSACGCNAKLLLTYPVMKSVRYLTKPCFVCHSMETWQASFWNHLLRHRPAVSERFGL